jgi:hypothetical protein
MISRLDEMVMNMKNLCSLRDRMIGSKNMILHRFTGYRHRSDIRDPSVLTSGHEMYCFTAS